MRTLTNANAILIDGTSDTIPENIAVWKAFAADAYRAARELAQVSHDAGGSGGSW